jgi:CBS domain-containing protein
MVLWFFSTATTYGTAIPAGLFFPGLLIGASLGQFVGRVLMAADWIPLTERSISVYSVVGGVAVLAGYCRLSFSLAVIFMETTQDVNLFIPMLLAVICSKGVGDMLNGSLYVQVLSLKEMPLVSNKISKRALDYTCKEVMESDVVSVNHSEKVRDLFDKLKGCKHNGFPVINERRKVIGMISRNHLVVILKNKFFRENPAPSALSLSESSFKQKKE